MGPLGIEPRQHELQSWALPLSYGPVLQLSLEKKVLGVKETMVRGF